VDIIGFQGSFHGRSYAAINASGNPNYLDGFGPKLPGYIQAPFGDLEALKKLVGPTTAGVILEPVQGEGGVRAATDEFLRGLRKLADEVGFLIIFDEVQSGAGRTGKMWAHEWSGVTPDVMAVAKGVGGGFPMGAFMATREAAKGMVKGVHGTTFGGNPLAMAVGNACYDELSKPGFLERVNVTANFLGQALEGVKDRHPDLVVETRGKGLLRGLKLKVDPKPIQLKLLERKVITGVAGDNVLRMAPPLVITEAELSQAIDTIDAVLAAQMAEAGA
jgi:acetylornithine/N-succinyldiaminopimelate aminotransferase